MKEKILDAVQQFETIIIHRHVRPDPDALGSQCGLAEVLKSSFPDKKILVTGETEPFLEFLYRMDEVSDEDYREALVIVCDTANQERISDQRYGKGKMLIKIDHHPNEDQYGDLIWVDTSASSVSEMIYEFYLSGKDRGLEISQKGAEVIYAGIVGDTGRFLFPSTTDRTFKYASELIDFGFPLNSLYSELYKTKINVAKLSGYVLQNFEVTPSGAASVIIRSDLLEKYETTPSEASQLVSILGDIEGMTAWVFFVEEKDQIRVRLRSKGPVINGLAKRYRGGGHPLAAGASIEKWEEAEKVFEELETICREYRGV
ncbi:bifunctional oligoribonuclease/PAP phosphatase NrnA [Bacillus mangrovi]|uniref:Bifunctional oligoribonuclease/PAP phosphatase NrnA n=1 Tax=Metabacillus mangrovi TaxID=1491830 RepID=A0A7X2V3Y9_9BACI|nr:bifunctional oligoribonuclease/PAP phosphatase NrnA [Metabacillus mangrovi]MTH52860.1 bifunctional oligoribonuclease/PAP phosphatase NrnA [Metabacillus mangrovi]